MENVEQIAMNELEPMVRGLFEQGYRFVTLDCIQNGEELQLLYHFDKDLKFTHLSFTIDKETVVPSISSIYFCAFLIENEIQDMFGLKFSGLIIDYKGKLLITDEVGHAPQLISNMVVSIIQKEDKEQPEQSQDTKREDQKGVL